MSLRRLLPQLPARIATGAYILHSGLGKWKGDEQQAQGVHGMAAGAYPFLADIPPTKFLRYLAIGEITIGLLLLTPFIPEALAGAALTGFSGGLVTMYLRTPALRKPGSFWPSPAGMAMAKDIWLLGIGGTLTLDGLLRAKDRPAG